MKIAHISDVHLRTLKRHGEYIKVFSSLYKSLEENCPDIIIIAGDIFHQKLSISPELIQIASDFLINLSAIAFTYIIPGNHDLLVSNPDRMDALTPIINNLKGNHNLYYYKNSGVYNLDYYHDLVVFSCVDDNWPDEEDINKNKINIGVYHGTINGAHYDNGFVIDNCDNDIDYFMNVVDYLLMGDLHEYQHVHERAAYAGSLIQQNFAENTNKGYLLWDIHTQIDFDLEFVKIQGIHPFYTIKLDDHLEFTESEISNIEKDSRVRIISKSLDIAQKKVITDIINKFCNPYEIRFADNIEVLHDLSHINSLLINSDKLKVDSLLDIKVQEKLIKNFLGPFNLDPLVFDRICEINKACEDEISKNENILRNVVFNLGRMEFSNLFSYGENNVFDFSKYKGVVGIFGPNASGKSSLAVDIPLYCICNKVSKKGVVKNDELINENKEKCSASIELFIDDEKHIINRDTSIYLKTGSKKGKPIYQGKTGVSFITTKNGEIVDNDAGKRHDTDLAIRQRFGNFDDFVITTFAPQRNLLGFIENGNTDRQKLLGRYFGVDRFEKKNELAKEMRKDIKVKIKLLENVNFEEDIEKFLENISRCEDEINENKETLKKYKKGLDKLKEELIKIKVLEESKLNNNSIITDLQWKLKIKENERNTLVSSIERYMKKISNFSKYSCLSNEGCALNRELQIHKNELDEKQEKLKIIDNDIVNNKKEIEEEKKKALEKKKDNENDNKIYRLKDKIGEVKNSIRFLEGKIENNNKEKIRYENKIEILKEQQKQFNECKDEYEAYEHYIKAVSKNGIVKKIIHDNLNIINIELSKILSSNVGFSAEIQASDNGKEIEIYFKYERGVKRRIELCSGMEKSMVAIAIRAALINTTTLPKTNVLILDEPISALDDEYIDAFGKILDYLKNCFEKIIIITHDYGIKDFCDHNIDIQRDEKGFGRIIE